MSELVARTRATDQIGPVNTITERVHLFHLQESTFKSSTVELGNKELFGRPKIVP